MYLGNSQSFTRHLKKTLILPHSPWHWGTTQGWVTQSNADGSQRVGATWIISLIQGQCTCQHLGKFHSDKLDGIRWLYKQHWCVWQSGNWSREYWGSTITARGRTSSEHQACVHVCWRKRGHPNGTHFQQEETLWGFLVNITSQIQGDALCLDVPFLPPVDHCYDWRGPQEAVIEIE